MFYGIIFHFVKKGKCVQTFQIDRSPRNSMEMQGDVRSSMPIPIGAGLGCIVQDWHE